METDNSNVSREGFRSKGSGRPFFGLVLVILGGVFLLRQLGIDIPEWVVAWQVLLIALGVFFGARRSFRPGGWMVMIFVGAAFLLNEFYPELNLPHYIWPVVIILFGLAMIFRPSRKRREWKWDQYTAKWDNYSTNPDNTVDVNAIFGGTKKKVMEKDFKGGSINSVFGGNDLDLSQADIDGIATLDVNVVFGGVKLIVPAHWKIKSEVDCAFGSVEDKRRDTTSVADNKTLVIKGGVVFGSIEIKSY